jgi:hypothetical protein
MDNSPPMDEVDRDFVAKMMARPRPSEVIDWPGDEPIPGYEKIRIIVPPDVAYDQARLAAHERMKKESRLPIEEWDTEANHGIMGDLIAKEMLARCCFRDRPRKNADGEEGEPFHQRLFGSSRDVEKALGKQELGVLFDAFLMIEHRLGPRLSILTGEEIDEWIKRLSGGLSPLARLVYPDLVELIRGLHQRTIELSGLLAQLQPHQSLNSPDTSESQDHGSSAMDTSSFGEQLEP